MVAIISALSSASIGRLKFTKGLISKQAMQMLQELEAFFSSNNNYKIYRDSLVSVKEPTIPHMAIFLQDLTFIEDGNPSMIKGLINFEQKRQMYNVIRQINSMQGKFSWLFKMAANSIIIVIPYGLFKVLPLHNLLRRLPFATEKQLYQMSLVNIFKR